MSLEVHRHLKLIRDLDSEVQTETSRVEAKQNDYFGVLRGAKDPKAESKRSQNLSLLDEIKSMQRGLLRKSYEKCQVASQLYERVDEFIARLDVAVKQAEEEVRVDLERLVALKETLPSKLTSKKRKRTDLKGKKKIGLKTSEKHQLNQALSEGRLALTPIVWKEAAYEPRYCTCKQPSYGDMIRCDNTFCTIEWFHTTCVGLPRDSIPESWFCNDCTALRSSTAQH
eukprot:TRINITY_DN833_c0_g1_i5.p1 TRINITY_DN833_c0_g1~~TRINITY_DN833_c0_g1_i5.p1  ORF type:complete len:227 (+),score=36.14 TRINITY_DN833_c0_g1_i5:159-839(+)